MFTIYFDEARQLLRWRLHGSWTETTVREFSIALMREILRLEKARVTFECLSDSTDFPRQSSDVTDALRSFANLAVGAGGRRVAVVTGRPLSVRQAERREIGGLLQFFLSEAEALTWLRLAEPLGRTSAQTMLGGDR